MIVVVVVVIVVVPEAAATPVYVAIAVRLVCASEFGTGAVQCG